MILGVNFTVVSKKKKKIDCKVEIISSTSSEVIHVIIDCSYYLQMWNFDNC